MEFPPVPPQGWLAAFKQEIDTAIAPVVGRVTTLEAGVKEVKDRMGELERRQTQVEKGTSSDQVAHVPTYVEITGFCAYEMRATEGVSRDQAADLVTKLKGMLQATAQETLGVPRLPVSQNVHSIRIPLVKTDHIDHIRETWRAAFELPDNKWAAPSESRTLRVVLEPEPITKNNNAMFGRLKNFAKIKTEGNAAYVVRDFWAPDYKMYLEPIACAQAPILLAELTTTATIKWNLEGLKLIGVESEEHANHGLLVAKHAGRS